VESWFNTKICLARGPGIYSRAFLLRTIFNIFTFLPLGVALIIKIENLKK
jgi:hypothetical protein